MRAAGAALLLCGAQAAAAAAPGPSAPRPHFLMILQDDLGFADVGFNNPAVAQYSPAITQLAKEGMQLTNHYVHWHCSPTRRSFLSGRLPIHHGEMLSGIDSDDIDLRWKILPQKLALAGYRSVWVGKGHTGYMSMKHMPTHRGFENFTGFLSGAQDYFSTDRWQGDRPYPNGTYSSSLYGDVAVQLVMEHDPSRLFFMYLPWQAVHEPYEAPPGPKPAGSVIHQMLWAADVQIGRVISAFKQKGMWEQTLVVYSADNGGVNDGCNYPKRGEKHTNWQGGMQVAAFVSGGFIPAEWRGQTAGATLHVVDWYPTFCTLAGVDPTDDSPKQPLPIDPSLPPVLPPPKDIWGEDSWPGVDGKNIWDILNSKEKREDPSAGHPELVLSREVILINGTTKLLVAQPDPSILADKAHMPPNADNETMGWKALDQTWALPPAHDKSGCGLAFWNRGHFVPCLFDIRKDPREMTNLAPQQPALTADLWAKLNTTFLTYYHSRTPASMLGHCDKACANKFWEKHGAQKNKGPICGVPGC